MPQPSTNRWQLMGDKQLGDTILLGIIARAFHLKKLVQSRPIDWSSRVHAVLPVPLDTWDAWKVSRARWDEASPFRADGCWLRRVNRLSAWKIVFLSFQRKKIAGEGKTASKEKLLECCVCICSQREKCWFSGRKQKEKKGRQPVGSVRFPSGSNYPRCQLLKATLSWRSERCSAVQCCQPAVEAAAMSSAEERRASFARRAESLIERVRTLNTIYEVSRDQRWDIYGWDFSPLFPALFHAPVVRRDGQTADP